MQVRLGVVILGLVYSTLASATPATPLLAVRHGRAIHVTIGGRSEDAFLLRAAAGGWRLELAALANANTGAAAAAGTLVLRDVTLGAHGPRTFELPLAAGAIVLDDARFRPDHAYRIELRRGTAVVGTALIYLQPNKQRGPVQFDDREANAPASGSDELQTSDKGTL